MRQYTVIAYALIRHYQGAKIDAHINAGGATHGWLHVIGISVVGLILTLIAVVVIAVAVMEVDTTETHNADGPILNLLADAIPGQKTVDEAGYSFTKW